jgi:chlorinating enzyme
MTSEQKAAWEKDGYFVVRGLVERAVCTAMIDEAVRIVRAAGPDVLSNKITAFEGLYLQREAQPGASAHAAEDHMAKIFNLHLREGVFGSFGGETRIVDLVAGVLGADVDCFQSQFIWKNPGAWGQPWHQDSHYFPFDKQPQVGVWLALTEATLENGCLSVLPGSHTDDLRVHGPDKRPGSNYGYLEVDVGAEGSKAAPMLMQPGDVLVFHSYLLHRSEDNRARSRRAALVYHYGRAGTRQIGEPNPVVHFKPVRRAA